MTPSKATDNFSAKPAGGFSATGWGLANGEDFKMVGFKTGDRGAGVETRDFENALTILTLLTSTITVKTAV